MAPTVAEAEAQLTAGCGFLEQLERCGATQTYNLVGHEDTLIQALEGENAARIAAGIANARARAASGLTRDAVREVLNPIIDNLCLAAGVDEFDTIEERWLELRKYYASTPRTVQKRVFSYGTITADGGNGGDGTFYRLKKDRYDDDLEGQFADAKVIEITGQEAEGAIKHRNPYKIYGAAKGKDRFAQGGGGLMGFGECIDGGISSQYLNNPSFSSLSSTVDGTALTSATGWTAGTIGNFKVRTDYYRDYQGDGNQLSIEFTVNDSLTQQLTRLAAGPWFLGFALKRKTSCDGTLTAALGASSKAITMTTLTNDVWTPQVLGPGDENWFEVFKQSTINLSFTLAGRTTGTVYLDDILLAPFTAIGGDWWAGVGGATQFEKEDFFTVGDSETGAIVQKWLWRAEYHPQLSFLHYAASLPNVTEPTVA